MTVAVKVTGPLCATFGELVETVVEVAKGPGGDGLGGGTELLLLPPPQPSTKEITKTNPNTSAGRALLASQTQRIDRIAAKMAKTSKDGNSLGRNSKGGRLERLEVTALAFAPLPETDGDKVSVADWVVPPERFTVEG